jgi:DNA-binding Lrp family transcriptional regulator
MKEIQLDDMDLRLLDLLQRDAAQSNQALAVQLHMSAPTCLRRTKRLWDLGLIEGQVALLNPERVAQAVGHGLQAIVEITLDRQGDEHLQAFELRVVADAEVAMCWRVAPGPDFVLVVHVHDMPAYLALVQRLFTQDANVRNVKAFFSVKRSKMVPALSLGPAKPN